MENEIENIEKLYEDYFVMFGKLPPMCTDSDYFDESKVKALKNAISTGKPL